MKQPHWPERWDFRKGAIYYRPRASERAEWGGKYYYRLGTTEAEAFTAWAEKHPRIVPRTISMGIALYKASRRWSKLADKTRKEYGKSLVRIELVFGSMRPQDLLPTDVYAYLDERPLVAGKRDVSALSRVMSECVRAGVIKHNPCLDVDREEEEGRDRYVTDAELASFASTCGAELQARLAVLSLTGTRPGQIRKLTLFAWDGEGLTVESSKRGRKVRYTGPRLKATITAMLAERKGKRAKSEFLFPNRSGKMYTADGWSTQFQRAMKLWGEAGNERFQERDLRAKVATDSESVSEAQERLGHQSSSTTNRVYRRGTVNVVELGSTALIKRATSKGSE